MVESHYLLWGAVYIFENPNVHRVKVGMTLGATSTVADRLRDVNDKWLERKVTCQICGRRLVNSKGLVPQHACLGGNALPLEKDVTLAESYLENMKNRLSELSGSEKGSAARKVNNLEKRIERYRHYKQPVGEWQFRVVFYTKCSEQVELLSHKILEKHLDKLAPFGEVFCCSVSEATEAVETVLSQLGLLHSARKETNDVEFQANSKKQLTIEEEKRKTIFLKPKDESNSNVVPLKPVVDIMDSEETYVCELCGEETKESDCWTYTKIKKICKCNRCKSQGKY